MNPKKRVYMAITHKDGYTVGESRGKKAPIKPVWNVRTFQTFDEADECAKRIASGEFEDWYPGEYVNNR